MTKSYSCGPQAPPLLEQTIGANLDATIDRFGTREALVSCHQGVRYTWSELGEAVDEVAGGLIAAGLVKRDRLAIWSPNCAEWTLVQFACAQLGVILVNVNPAYQTSELRYVLRQSGARMLVSAVSHKRSDYRAMVAEVRADLRELELVVFLGSDEWESLLGNGAGVDPSQVAEIGAALEAHEPINIQYTSGTTGFPKGATLTHRNLLNNGYYVGEGVGYSELDRVCIPVPFYHCFGMVMGNLACSSHGAAMVIPAPSFEPEATLRACSQERCTSLYGVPTMFIAELDHARFAEFDLRTLRTGIMAGSPCPVEVMKRVIERMHMTEVGIAYGMTETSPVSLQTAVDDPIEKRVGTVGRVGPHLEVKIIDPADGSTVPRGGPGELCTRGYSVMLGYWEDPERTAEAIDSDDWMHTGDLATMDDEGYVNIVGRIKDVVIRGRIAHYKIPRYVKLVDGFPMTVTGKVQKFRMREQAIDELALGPVASARTA